jgi:hypothetical protein
VTIREREIRRGAIVLFEFWRDDAAVVLLVLPSAADGCRRIKNDETRWKCLKTARFAQRKKREDE